MTVTTTLDHGVIYEDTTSIAMDQSHHCPTVTVPLSVQVTVVPIVIKQECDAQEIMELCVPKMETCDLLAEIMKTKEY